MAKDMENEMGLEYVRDYREECWKCEPQSKLLKGMFMRDCIRDIGGLL